MGFDPYRYLRGAPMVSENAEPGQQDAPVGGPRPQLARMRQGVENALAGLEVDFRGKVGLGDLVGALRDSTNATSALHRWLASNPQHYPNGRWWKASLAPNAAAPTFSVLQFQPPFDAGGPNAGFRWQIGAHAIWGTDPFTTVANSSAALYIGAIPPLPGAAVQVGDPPVDMSIRYSVTTLPWAGAFPPHSVTIMPGDTAYYIVKSVGNNQQINAALWVWEYREGRGEVIADIYSRGE